MDDSRLNIPRVCHLFWDGFPMSIYHTVTVTSFHKQNPDWEIIIWLSKQSYKELGENTFVGEYIGPDYFSKVAALPYVQIKEVDLQEWGVNLDIPSCSGSDIFRMLVLQKYGGCYSDFDIIWIKPIDHLLQVECIGDPIDFDCTVCFHLFTRGFQNISTMIAKKDSTYIGALIKEQSKVKPPYEHQSYGSALITETFPTLFSIMDANHKVLAVKYETFFPYPVYALDKLFDTIDLSVITKNVIGIHWFCGHKISLRFLNQGRKRLNSFEKLIKRVTEGKL